MINEDFEEWWDTLEGLRFPESGEELREWCLRAFEAGREG